MRLRSGFALCASLAVLVAGCAPSIQVRTIVAPGSGLQTLHTFRILPGPDRRDGRALTGADDPMINNSIANRAIRDRITSALQERGYTPQQGQTDFVVAFYASSRSKLDVSMWDYGYPAEPEWPRRMLPYEAVTGYTEGAVIIDLVNPLTNALLWRGSGTATLTDNATENVKQLVKVADAIISQLPHSLRLAVAPRP